MKFDKDTEYFNDYPAPIFQAVQEGHFTNINGTIPFFGVAMYFLCRAMDVGQVLEIGHAEGYSSRYLASAVKDNGIRYGLTGNMYYGVDIVQTEKVRELLTQEGLPNTIINMDSILLTPKTFEGITFDLIFLDGAHDKEHVVHEFKNLWGNLRSDGKGYMFLHDSLPNSPAYEGCQAIRDMIDVCDVNARYVDLWNVFGMTVIQKLGDKCPF